MDALKFLLENGADAMGRRSGCGMTPLMNAIGLQRDEARDILSAYCTCHAPMDGDLLIILTDLYFQPKNTERKEK